MATFLTTPNGRFKAIIRNVKGRYLRSKTFTRKTDARTWARRMEADQEAMEALGESGARLPFWRPVERASGTAYLRSFCVQVKAGKDSGLDFYLIKI
jgi:hypothetical protein